MKKAKLLCGTCLAALLSIAALTACGGGGNNGKDLEKFIYVHLKNQLNVVKRVH